VAVRAAVRFGPPSRAAFADPRLSIHVGDPADLLARGDRWDVILLEPSGGWTERSGRVSTREFLRGVRDRLGEGGLAAQWVPDSGLTREGFLVLLATWADAFPQVEVWAGHGGDVVVLGKAERTPGDFSRVVAAYRDGRVAAACARAWIGSPETLLSQFLVGDATVRRLAAGRPVCTLANDELTRREADRRRSSRPVDPVPGLGAIRDDVVETLVNTPQEGFAPALALAVRARDLERAGLDLELEGRFDEACDTYRQAIESNPRDGAARRAFASLRSRLGIDYGIRQSLVAAHAYLREAVETDTTYAQGFANLGLLLLQSEDFDYAIACTGQAITLEPEDDLFQLQLGRIWKQRRFYDKAMPYYEKAMSLNPLNVEAAIGYVDNKLVMEGRSPDIEGGIAILERYRKIDPYHEDLQMRIGKLHDALERVKAGLGPDSTAPGP
jgi:Flp pilus assembly protein TadD